MGIFGMFSHSGSTMVYQPGNDPKRRARRQATHRAHGEQRVDHRVEHRRHERPQHPQHPSALKRLLRPLQGLLSSMRAFSLRDWFTHTSVGNSLAKSVNSGAKAGAVKLQAGAAKLPASFWMVLAILAILPLTTGLRGVAPDALNSSIHSSIVLPTAANTLIAAPLEASSSESYVPGLNDEQWQLEIVKKDETVGTIFSRLGLSATELHRVLSFSDNTAKLAKVFPGEQIAFQISGGDLQALQFDANEKERVLLKIDGKTLSEKLISRSLETRISYASATIRRSLFGDGSKADMSQRLIFRMAELFNYDIDFAQDLQPGDSFAVVYEQVYRDGERLRDGEILAATFVNQGKRYEIFRHISVNGQVDYLGVDGRSRKKAFIRTPVDFTRISSLFSPNRRHPVLGSMRRHMGVDYAAPTGTPIKASGNGVVKTVGWMGGYGNTVVVQHKGGIETLYAHMVRFPKGLKRGDRVKQSEVIGYVGMSGLATGPHLHYEFRIGGKHRDPLSVDLPIADPLSPRELAQFNKTLSPLVAQLRLMESAHVAKAPRSVRLKAIDS